MQFLHCLLKDLYHQDYLLSSLQPQCLTNQYKRSELLVPNQRGKFNIKSCCIILIHVSVKSNLRNLPNCIWQVCKQLLQETSVRRMHEACIKA